MSLASVFAALANDPASLAAFLKQIPAGICIYDSESRALSTSDLFTRIVGGAAADGQPPAPLLPLLARAQAGEAVMGAEVDLPTDTAPLRLQVSLIPIRNGGQVTGVAAVVSDGSAEAGQRETLGIVGHDLRNPLAAIRMTAQLLGKGDEMTSERRLTLSKRILTSSIRMDGIVKSLLDYARARAGAAVRLEREPMDLGALTARVIADQTANVTGRSVELQTTGDLKGRWDPDRLEQIVGHLVCNALRHGTGTLTRVIVDGTAHTHVLLAVHNDCEPPIPPALLAHIFDPFQIGPRPPGTPRRSIGLGLFVVRELTHAHGGQVSASSDPASTQFRVSLPRDVVTPP
jgi:signal transduction histidine kinase